MAKKISVRPRLLDIFRRLEKAFGPQHWWPAESALEMILGAFLTQNTSWRNASAAILNLKKKGKISVSKLLRTSSRSLAGMVKPAGYFNVKARRIRNFVVFINKKYRTLENLFKEETPLLRAELLGINGIGPETADSILLYAARRPVFVVDAYTRRIFSRLGLAPETADYAHFQTLFMENLPARSSLFNEYHALIVRLAKTHCTSRPECLACPLLSICVYGRSQTAPQLINTVVTLI